MSEGPRRDRYSSVFETKFGLVHAIASDAGLHALKTNATQQPDGGDHPMLARVRAWFEAYGADARTPMDLPLAPEGTAFERTVWDALLAIPVGETRSYAQIATAIGQPKAVRAVGRANGANPIGILVPCHRVIGSDGQLRGYAGGLDLKERLLTHEGALAPLYERAH